MHLFCFYCTFGNCVLNIVLKRCSKLYFLIIVSQGSFQRCLLHASINSCTLPASKRRPSNNSWASSQVAGLPPLSRTIFLLLKSAKYSPVTILHGYRYLILANYLGNNTIVFFVYLNINTDIMAHLFTS